jgi:hypothetical protein
MRQQPDNKRIIKYLLGTLSQAETERLDELSFTDPGFIDELNSVERDLIDAYVNGELDSLLQSQFENHYLKSPLRREKVQLARSFYESTPRSITPTRAFQQKESQIDTQRNPFVPVSREQWAFAAVLLIGLCLAIGGWLILERDGRTPTNNQIAENKNTRDAGNEKITAPGPTPQASLEATPREVSPPVAPETANRENNNQSSSVNRANVASVILAPPMRGGTTEPAVTLMSRTEYVAIRLELEPNDYSTYRVSLLNQAGGQVLWRSNRSVPQTKDGDKSLNVRFPATLLKPRSYVLRVWGLSQTGVAEMITDYRFRVVRQ